MGDAERTQLNDFYDQPIAEETRQEVLKLCGLDTVDRRSKQRLLDFGAGGGRYMECFASVLGKENVVGVEVDDDQIARARGKGFCVAKLDVNQASLPYDDEAFDIVFSSNVIEHIPREMYLVYLQEINRVLTSGGRFVVGTPNYPFKRMYDIKKGIKTRRFRYYFFDDPTHCNPLTCTQLERDLNPYFQSIHVQPTYLLMERKLPFLKRSTVRHRLRHLGDKLVGVCIK